MKVLQALFLSLVLAEPAALAGGGFPDCWTTNGRDTGFNAGGDEIVDGQWLVNVNLRKATKEDVRWLMFHSQSGHLRHANSPIVFEPDFMILQVQAKREGMRRDLLRRQANAQVAELWERRGVSAVECNGIQRPQ